MNVKRPIFLLVAVAILFAAASFAEQVEIHLIERVVPRSNIYHSAVDQGMTIVTQFWSEWTVGAPCLDLDDSKS